jgi:Na+-driven multidrug efflux pump
MVFSLSNVCIQSAINGFGTAAIAGSAAAVNFEYFSYYVMNAFAQTVVTFTSQNFGAKKYDRCKRVFWLCMACGMIGTAAMSLTFVVTRTMVIRIYTVDEAAIAYALIRMTHVLVFQCLGGSFEISGGALRGMGHSLGPAVMTVFGTCVLRVAWVYFVFPKWNTFGMLLYVYPVTWIITGLLVCGTYFALRGRLFAKNPTHY